MSLFSFSNANLGNNKIFFSDLKYKSISKLYLNVVLQEGFKRFPAEAACELFGPNRLLAVLQLVENALQSERHAALRIVRLGRHEVNRSPQFMREVERLQERVHVARGALVLQANEARMPLRVPGHAVRRIGLHMHPQEDRIVLKQEVNSYWKRELVSKSKLSCSKCIFSSVQDDYVIYLALCGSLVDSFKINEEFSRYIL